MKTKLAALKIENLNLIVLFQVSRLINLKQNPHLRNDSNHHNQAVHQPQSLAEISRSQVCYFHRKFGDRAFNLIVNNRAIEELTLLWKTTGIHVDSDRCERSFRKPTASCLRPKNGQNFLIDTGAEISILKPTLQDMCNITIDRELSSANGSRIATLGNKSMILKFYPPKKFRRTFIVVDVALNIVFGDNFILTLRGLAPVSIRYSIASMN